MLFGASWQLGPALGVTLGGPPHRAGRRCRSVAHRAGRRCRSAACGPACRRAAVPSACISSLAASSFACSPQPCTQRLRLQTAPQSPWSQLPYNQQPCFQPAALQPATLHLVRNSTPLHHATAWKNLSSATKPIPVSAKKTPTRTNAFALNPNPPHPRNSVLLARSRCALCAKWAFFSQPESLLKDTQQH